MSRDHAEKILTGMNEVQRKELLDTLALSLFKSFSESEKKKFLQKIISGDKTNLPLIDMVEHWIEECTDSGVNPIEMSKEVLAAISHTYELSTYSTPELRSLFNDWLGEIERLVVGYVVRQKKADPDDIAEQFNLNRDSAIFIVSKLTRAGKVTMQASGNGSSKIRLVRGKNEG